LSLATGGPLDPAAAADDLEPDERGTRRRAFSLPFSHLEGGPMANHLTPEELAKEMGMERDEVVRICIEEGVPIYHGKIDKTLFQASLEAISATAGASAQT
jgi:hypothetical protein